MMDQARHKLLRRARDMAAKAIDDTATDQERSRAMHSLDVLTLRHEITMGDFDELKEYEQDRADRAAAYLDRNQEQSGWLKVELLEIARGIALTSEDQQAQTVLIALQDKLVEQAMALHRARTDSLKPNTVKLNRRAA